MDVLIIGFSSIVTRRVIPALTSLPGISKIHISSRRYISLDIIPQQKRGQFFHGYENAILHCNPCLCYISLPNSMHAYWARKALEEGFHVIVDKPAVVDIAEAEMLFDLANNKGLCFSEANVWYYHPITQALRGLISKEASYPIALLAIFSSPALNSKNFRYKPTLGGGILLDRGPYAVSCGRIIFEEKPTKIISKAITSDTKDNLDISFSVIMAYPCGSIFQGLFSLEAEYRNTLSVIGKNYFFDVERIFTPPADFEGKIYSQKKNHSEIIPVKKGDSFAIYFANVLKSLSNGEYTVFSRTVLEDTQVLHQIISKTERG